MSKTLNTYTPMNKTQLSKKITSSLKEPTEEASLIAFNHIKNEDPDSVDSVSHFDQCETLAQYQERKKLKAATKVAKGADKPAKPATKAKSLTKANRVLTIDMDTRKMIGVIISDAIGELIICKEDLKFSDTEVSLAIDLIEERKTTANGKCLIRFFRDYSERTTSIREPYGNLTGGYNQFIYKTISEWTNVPASINMSISNMIANFISGIVIHFVRRRVFDGRVTLDRGAFLGFLYSDLCCYFNFPTEVCGQLLDDVPKVVTARGKPKATAATSKPTTSSLAPPVANDDLDLPVLLDAQS